MKRHNTQNGNGKGACIRNQKCNGSDPHGLHQKQQETHVYDGAEIRLSFSQITSFIVFIKRTHGQ